MSERDDALTSTGQIDRDKLEQELDSALDQATEAMDDAHTQGLLAPDKVASAIERFRARHPYRDYSGAIDRATIARIAELEAENAELRAVNDVLKNMLRKIMEVIDSPGRPPNRLHTIAREAEDALASLAKAKGGPT